MKKKALIVVNLAGFLHFLWNDIATLQEMGYQVDVAMNELSAAGPNQIEIPRLDEMGIRYYQVDFDTKSPLSKKNGQAYGQLKKILNGETYDLIHCHTPIAGIITRLAARKSRRNGTKVIYTTHGFTFTDRSSKKSWMVYYTVEKLMSLFCDAIITINHEDYNNARRMWCKKVYLLPSVGIDLRRFENVGVDRFAYRSSFGVGENDIMVLAVGELSQRKNQQIIIQALGSLSDKERYVFVICGTAVVNSSVPQNLKDLAEQLGVRLVLAGHRLDIPQINACADVAVIPSVREGFGMSGVEALASGLPVAGADVQGIREYVIPGETGYRCDPYSAREFADAIKKLADRSEKEKESMADRCRRKAEEFDVTKSISVMKKIYQEVLSCD